MDCRPEKARHPSSQQTRPIGRKIDLISLQIIVDCDVKALENQSPAGNPARSSGWGKEWDGEKEEENKTKSLEEENKFSEEKLWQP